MPPSKKSTKPAHCQLTQEERYQVADAKEQRKLIQKQHKTDVREKTANKKIRSEVKKTEKVHLKYSELGPVEPSPAPKPADLTEPPPAPNPADLTETDSDVEIIKVEPAPVNPDLVETESESDRE